MRKLSLAIADIRVESYQIEDAPYAAGTVAAFQTEPASVPEPCTGPSWTYPVRSCQTCHCKAQDEPAAPRAKA
jgi:hypothetical protein